MKGCESYLELLKLNVEETPVIAVVGGGGKTSLIFRLTEELTPKGKRVIITTTTHMAYEPDRPFANGGDKVLVEKNLRQFGYTVAAEWTQGAVKVGSLPEKQLRELKDCCDVFLIEADGSKQLPLKVPENWEPVIPSIADLVISVVGLDCLGKPIRQTAHRMERTSEFLKKSLDAPVTPEDVVKIASSICGLFKNVEDRVYRVYLNKADILPDSEPAEEILKGLTEQHTVAAYGSLKEQEGIV
jgi:probable selenium-dependent hydroxylase accessory protein YqeC